MYLQVEILGRAPRKGSSPKDVVYAVMKKPFDWSMTRHLNIRGTKEKNSIYKHPLYSVIVGEYVSSGMIYVIGIIRPICAFCLRVSLSTDRFY